MKASLILSTYNQPEWLRKVLIAYQAQTEKNFEILIADDGSDQKTKNVVRDFSSDLNLQHIWHPDEGFRKSEILNTATLASQSDYLIFSDGDCIPRPDFIATHLELRAPDYFLSGGYCKLPLSLSQKITRNNIESRQIFSHAWLRRNGLRGSSATLKTILPDTLRGLADLITPTKATWNGNNSSTWKKDILEVNGHNEDMAYGGEDREMGERLRNKGLKPKQIRYRTILLHLDHSRSYADPKIIEKNMAIRHKVMKEKLIHTINGIKKTHP